MTELNEMSRGDMKRENRGGGPRCPRCGSSDVEHSPEEKGDHGFTMHHEHWDCLECGHQWH